MRAWGTVLLTVALLVLGAPAVASSEGQTGTQTPAPRVAGAVVGPVPGLVPTRIRWTRWSRLVVYGGTAVLEGQVVTDDGALPEVEVELLARRAGDTHWRSVGTARSSADTAVFAFGDLSPEASTDYRVVFDGDLVYAASEAVRRVPVARRVRDGLRRIDAERFALRGSVAPTYRGRAVLLQRKTCRRCSWSTLATTQTNRRSRWSFVLRAPSSRGAWFYRATVPGDRLFVRSYGDHVWRITRR